MGIENDIARKRQTALGQQPPKAPHQPNPAPWSVIPQTQIPGMKETGSGALPKRPGQPDPNSLIGPGETLTRPSSLFTIMIVNGVSEADYKFALRVLGELLQLPNDFQSGPRYITRAFAANNQYPIIQKEFDISNPPPDLSPEVREATAMVMHQAQAMTTLAELYELPNGFVYINRADQGSQGFHAVVRKTPGQVGPETPQLNSPPQTPTVPAGWFSMDEIAGKK